mgnify:CR=1 FL=1
MIGVLILDHSKMFKIALLVPGAYHRLFFFEIDKGLEHRFTALFEANIMGVAVSDEEWSAFRERLKQYMAKATKEAKVNTSWLNPVAEYDTAMQEQKDQGAASWKGAVNGDLWALLPQHAS